MKTEPKYKGDGTLIWAPEVIEGDPFALGMWIIHAPWAHSMWGYFAASLIHLRDVEGHPPANMQFPEATHELVIMALDPSHYPPDEDELHYLTPPNIAQQFTADNDAAALETIELLMQKVAEKRISPDEDFRSAWRHVLLDHTREELKEHA